MESTNQLTNKLLEIINQVQNQVSAHAGDAINILLLNTQIDAINNLVIGFLSLGIACITFFFLKKFWIGFQKESSNYTGDEFPYIMGMFLCGLLFLISLLLSINYLLDIWNWMALFNPKLALAHSIIQHFTK